MSQGASTLIGDQLTVGYPGRPPVLAAQSVRLEAGRITALIGPNGSGKSTLLKALAHQLPARGGRALLDGRDVARTPTRALARALGILFQDNLSPSGMTVEDLVYHGRHPHRGFFQDLDEADHAAVERALALTGIDALRHRPLQQLSGGQRQLAWLSLALAQEPRVLLLDEPTTFLDLRHQLAIMEVVAELRRSGAVTIALVLHDINQAARYADDLYALKAGRVVAQGPPRSVLTPALLREVFEIEADVIDGPDGAPLCVPRGLTPRPPHSPQGDPK